MEEKTIEITGPYFEDFKHGQIMEPPPSVTLTPGHVVFHQSLFGDRLRLSLDRELCRKVVDSREMLINPHLFFNIAVGQTTFASQHVKGNLFYRGVVFKNPVFTGDTLTTTTKVVALRQNKFKKDRPATGMVVLEMKVINQHDEELMRFWRCPMIACRHPRAETGHADALDAFPAELGMDAIEAAVPANWKLDLFRETISGDHFDQVAEGTTYRIVSRDTVTAAPELARLTLNMAMIHTDAQASHYKKRLVYGGHVIAMAAARISRALPNIVTVLAWKRCDHTAPVFENDILHTDVTVLKKRRLSGHHLIDRMGTLEGPRMAKHGGLVELHAVVYASREKNDGNSMAESKVLDWELVILMA